MKRWFSQLRDRYDRTPLLHAKAMKFLPQAMIILVVACGEVRILQAQSSVASNNNAVGITDPCTDPSTHSAIKDAFRLVCSREVVPVATRTVQAAIVIGFLGGFAKQSDVKHPEVLFANYLRSRYSPIVRAAVFGNHEAEKALKLIRLTVDTEKDGVPGSTGKETVKVILYGHSWGASQVLEFARELERQEIPVALTIQIDSVRKIRQDDRTVPANVAKAVNYYQRKGLTPGRPFIIPADAERTKILGNYQMTYKDQDVRCDNYHWVSRTLNKPHHQIENDPHVWDKIVTLIDSELANPNNEEATQSAARAWE